MISEKPPEVDQMVPLRTGEGPRDPFRETESPTYKKSPISKLREMPRPSGYVEDVMHCGIRVTDEYVWMDWSSPCVKALLEKYRHEDETEEDRVTDWDTRKMKQQNRERARSGHWYWRAWRRRMRPGDWWAVVFQAVTFGMLYQCPRCRSRRRDLNEAGWLWHWVLVINLFWWFNPRHRKNDPETCRERRARKQRAA